MRFHGLFLLPSCWDGCSVKVKRGPSGPFFIAFFMATFLIKYQDVPFAYTTPHSLVIEAESSWCAMRTAAIHLTRKGNVIGGVGHPTVNDLFLAIEDLCGSGGVTRFTGLREVDMEMPGKVVGEY